MLSYQVFVSLQESFCLLFHKYCLVYNFIAIVIIYYTYLSFTFFMSDKIQDLVLYKF